MALMDELVHAAAQPVAQTFLDKGLLGVVCLMAIGVACFFYREKRKIEKRNDELVERHLAKAEKWIEKYNEHARDMRTVLDSLSRRM